jgi:adenine-specific DNA-methyltransferase
MDLNVADGGLRRYVIVQLPEQLDPTVKDKKASAKYCDKLGKPRTIAELTKERLRIAAKKIKEDAPLVTGDLGFRVFKLDSSNIRAWNPHSTDLEAQILTHVDHLVEGRSEVDILYELLLKLGLDLCVPIEQRTITRPSPQPSPHGGEGVFVVHAVGGGVLLACLAPAITGDDVEALAQGIVAWHRELAPAGDATCVFRDSAFADDVAKTNLTAILQQHGLKNVRSL